MGPGPQHKLMSGMFDDTLHVSRALLPAPNRSSGQREQYFLSIVAN